MSANRLDDVNPPYFPMDEVALRDDSLMADCVQAIQSSAERHNYLLGKSVLSRSPKWGIVLRTDFRVADNDSVNHRVICWLPPDSPKFGMVYVFENLDPLP